MMRVCTHVPLLTFALLWSSLVPTVYSFAGSKPPGHDPVNGLGGTVNIAAAASTVIDRSYAMNLLGGSSRNVAPTKAPSTLTGHASYARFAEGSLTLGQYIDQILVRLPENVAGIAFQERAYDKGPSYIAAELSLGHLSSGLDAAYQHYEGGLHGDGFGLRYVPNTRGNQFVVDVDEMEADEQHVMHYARNIEKTDPNVFNERYDKLAPLITGLGAAGDYKNLGLYISKLDAFIPATKGPLAGDETPLERAYGRASLEPDFALIAGYSHVSGISVGNFGLSASWLRPLAKPVTSHGVSGVGALISAQENVISIGPGADTSIVQSGLAIAWQDRVASQERPHDRWQALLGAEYLLRTSLDRSATYDLFARYRPFARTSSGGYVPLEFTVFGGIGPNGYGYAGARVGFGFSL